MKKNYAVVYFNPNELNPTIMYAATTLDGAASYVMTLGVEPEEGDDSTHSFLSIVCIENAGYSEEYDDDQCNAAVTYCYAESLYCDEVKEGYYYINEDYNVIMTQSYDREALEEALGLI